MSDLNEIERGQLCQSTIQCLYSVTGSLSNFPGLIKKIITSKAWERRICKGRVIELASLRQLITSKPLDGWGEDPKKIEAVIKDDAEAAQMFRDAMKGEPGRKEETDNIVIPLDTPQGNSKAYTLSRLKRENEELFEAVVAGELSANAAAIKAGFRKKASHAEICVKAFKKTDCRLSVLKAIATTLEPHEWEYLIDLRSE